MMTGVSSLSEELRDGWGNEGGVRMMGWEGATRKRGEAAERQSPLCSSEWHYNYATLWQDYPFMTSAKRLDTTWDSNRGQNLQGAKNQGCINLTFGLNMRYPATHLKVSGLPACPNFCQQAIDCNRDFVADDRISKYGGDHNRQQLWMPPTVNVGYMTIYHLIKRKILRQK